MSETTDPTAGEPYCTACLLTDQQCIEADGGCCDVCRSTAGCSHTTEPTSAEPDAGDVEALAGRVTTVTWEEHLRLSAMAVAREHMRMVDEVDAVRRKAGDDRAEQIAQSIESDAGHWTHAARIARESR